MDLIDPVQYFFRSGKLIKEVYATINTFVPKNLNPSLMGDFRSISYCNVVYKCITKILANRLLPCFIRNRSISENILLAQEIVKDYHKDEGQARRTIKVDLMKAYDSLGWDFILHCLTYLRALNLLACTFQVCEVGERIYYSKIFSCCKRNPCWLF